MNYNYIGRFVALQFLNRHSDIGITVPAKLYRQSSQDQQRMKLLYDRHSAVLQTPVLNSNNVCTKKQ